MTTRILFYIFQTMQSSREKKICHDCGCKEGELHQVGCDMERCYKCGGQLISCDPFSGCNGIHETFEHNRVPYIQYPNICQYCGALWPDFFSVPDKEWKKYIELGERDKVICRPCFDHIKQSIDGGSKLIDSPT